MMAARFQILGVKLPTADQDAAGCLGTVTFGYCPSEFDPSLKLVKYGKTDKADATIEYDDVDIIGQVRGVKFHDRWIKTNSRGPFVSLGGWKIPREVSDAVALEAADQLHALSRKQVPAANVNGLIDDVFGDAATFTKV